MSIVNLIYKGGKILKAAKQGGKALKSNDAIKKIANYSKSIKKNIGSKNPWDDFRQEISFLNKKKFPTTEVYQKGTIGYDLEYWKYHRAVKAALERSKEIRGSKDRKFQNATLNSLNREFKKKNPDYKKVNELALKLSSYGHPLYNSKPEQKFTPQFFTKRAINEHVDPVNLYRRGKRPFSELSDADKLKIIGSRKDKEGIENALRWGDPYYGENFSVGLYNNNQPYIYYHGDIKNLPIKK